MPTVHCFLKANGLRRHHSSCARNIAVLCCWALVTFIYHVFSLQAHYIKATAFRGTGCSEEALQEYFFCVALKSDWIAVKLEAQKVH